MTESTNDEVTWSNIDKTRFFGIGTVLYTGITLCLHPINVLKTRQQVLQSNNNKPSSLLSSQLNNPFMKKLKLYYRGIGIILISAVPARGVYLGVLEQSKEFFSSFLMSAMKSSSSYDERNNNTLPLIASISGGLAGGLAAMASQSIIVPMDVISQRQMVMDTSLYKVEGSAFKIMRNIVKIEGYGGFYKGFGMSLFTSLPVGTLWWATYSGCHQMLQNLDVFKSTNDESSHMNEVYRLSIQGMKQIIAGGSAAIVAASLTQPLDVVRTRLQVGNYANSSAIVNATYTSICSDLYTSDGLRGFFRGVTPRVISMSLWGTVLSTAYEFLRHVSRKDHEFTNQWIINLQNRASIVGEKFL